MFDAKQEVMKKQREIHLQLETEYCYLIEALLFKEQKKHFGSIEYITNGYNLIEIKILKSKNIKEISLPFYDSNMPIWKSKSYSIEYIKNNSKQIIDGYTIYIDKVDNLESSKIEQFVELNEKFSKLREKHEELLKPKKVDEELAKLNSENFKLKQDIENLDKLKNEEFLKLRKEYEEKLSRLRKEKEELAKQCFTKYNIDNLIVKDDNIIHGTQFIFDLSDQDPIKFTLSELIQNDYIIRNEKIELIVNSMTIENVNVEFVPDEKKFIYRYNYDKKYKDRNATFPHDEEITYKLVNDAEYKIYQMGNYNVYIHVTLK